MNFGLFNLFELLNKDLDILSNDLVILDSIKEIMGLKSNKKNDLSYDEVMGINGNITPMLEILKTVKEYSIKWRTDNGFSISNIPITILELSENKIQEDFKRYCKAKSVSEIAQNYILTNL